MTTRDRPKNFSIQRLLKMSVLAPLAAIVGCQRMGNPPPDVLEDTPIATDSAMQLRQWEESQATYARTGVMVAATGETWRISDDSPFYIQYLEVPLFLANIIVSPVAIFRQPPWELYEGRSTTIEPTYHAMPPLPPSDEPEDLETMPPEMIELQPSDRPGDRPLEEAPDTLPRPTDAEPTLPGGAAPYTPPPSVPAAPARDRGPGGAPTNVPTNERIVPSTQPTMPATLPSN